MLILLLIFALFRLLQGAPVSPTPTTYDPVELCLRTTDTANSHLGTREVRDIVISCLATIFACTWTTIHHNIPAPNESGWESLKHRVITMIYALLAPEAITGWALRQKIAAEDIADEYNEKVLQDESKIPKKLTFFGKLGNSVIEWIYGPHLPSKIVKGEVRPWTTTHGFFLQMGGFMMCKDGVPVKTLRYRDRSSAIGSYSFYEKFQTGFLHAPTITEAEIKDRSKGDVLSKTIVILQTTWFIAQCIARWSAHLPVTELEVITLGFAALNALTYWLWWNKPQSVGLPVYLEIQNRTAEVACQTSNTCSGHTDEATEWPDPIVTGPTEGVSPDAAPATEGSCRETQSRDTWAEPAAEPDNDRVEWRTRFETVDAIDKDAAIPAAETFNDAENAIDSREGGISESAEGPTPLRDLSPAATDRKSYVEENNRSDGLTETPTSYCGRVKSELRDIWHHRNQTTPSKSYFRRDLERARKKKAWILLLIAPIAAVLRPLSKLLQFTTHRDDPKNALHISMFSSALADSSTVYIASSLIAAAFGLIHFIPAWFLDFPSVPEKLLWRISAAIITGEPIILAIWTWLREYIDISDHFDHPANNYTSFNAFEGIVLYLGIPLYIIARVTLITLAFISLRHLPPEALVAIDWISFVPHL